MRGSQLHARRKERIRTKLRRINLSKPRMTVHRTNCHIYAQIIDDSQSITVASASTIEQNLRTEMKNTGNAEAAAVVGKLVAERAKAAGIDTVVFDRSGYIYHGRVKALAEAARQSGLNF